MKTIFIFIFASAIGVSAFAQNNLQFNQVKLVTTSETVPAGKVWKVESVLSPEVRYPSNNSSDFPSNSRVIAVNGGNVAIHEVFVNGVGLGFNSCCGIGTWMTNTGDAVNNTQREIVSIARENTRLPLWLPSATTLAAGTNVSSISVIEFNIVN